MSKVADIEIRRRHTFQAVPFRGVRFVSPLRAAGTMYLFGLTEEPESIEVRHPSTDADMIYSDWERVGCDLQQSVDWVAYEEPSRQAE